MSGIVSRSFRLNVMVLKLVGLYPPERFPQLHKVYAVSLFVLSMTSPMVFGTLHFIFTEDLTTINYNDCLLVGTMVYAFKFWPFLRNDGEIKKCVEYFDDCVGTNSSRRPIIEDCVSTCQRNSLGFLSGCVVAFVGIIGQLLVEGNMEKLPINVWLPDVCRETSIIYYCIYFLLIIGLAYGTAASGTIDPLIGGLSHHAAAQLQILALGLQFLDQNEGTNHNNVGLISKNDNVYRKIKMYIEHYQHIINFVEKYQKCFSPVVFSQLVGSVIIIGFCCFQLSMTKVDLHFFVNLLSLSLLFFQVFFYCYYGTLLTEENEALFRAIYLSKWYEYDQRSKKALLVLMERLKRPMVVNVGKVLALSLETFTTILKRSYSFVALLKNY